MKLLISILLGIALCNAQTIEITIPGRTAPGGTAPGGQNSKGGGGGSSIGLVIGALVGLGISLLITKAVFGKAKPDAQKNGNKRPPLSLCHKAVVASLTSPLHNACQSFE